MTLQLPPERSLDDPNGRVDRILNGQPVPLPGRPAHRRRWIGGLAVAAALALVATAAGTGVLHRDRPQVAAPAPVPAKSVVPAPTPTESPEPPTDPPDMMVHLLGETMTFPTLTAQVIDVTRDPAWYSIKVRTCLLALPPGSTAKVAPVNWNAWTLTTSTGTVDTSIRQEGTGPWKTTYPFDGTYRPGQCASGWIPIGLPKKAAVTAVNYHDHLGNTTSWQTASQPSRVGATLNLPQVRVTLQAADHLTVNDDPVDEYVIRVTTCALVDHLRLRSAFWTLTTNAGTVKVTDPIAKPVPLPTTFPDGTYGKGHCATGVIPFAVPHDDNVKTVDYRDTAGGRASWFAGG